jgi:uncharacterized protein YndB with AHSA1/START domain
MNLTESTVHHSTFALERAYKVAPDRVFAAFADPAQKRRWYAGNRSTELEQFEMDFRVGGRDRALYRFQPGSPFPGTPLLYEIEYQDIVPGSRIVIAYRVLLGDRRISASLATFEFLPSGDGTTLMFTEQGAFFEGADGPAMREAGWRSLLDRVADHLAG